MINLAAVSVADNIRSTSNDHDHEETDPISLMVCRLFLRKVQSFPLQKPSSESANLMLYIGNNRSAPSVVYGDGKEIPNTADSYNVRYLAFLSPRAAQRRSDLIDSSTGARLNNSLNGHVATESPIESP